MLEKKLLIRKNEFLIEEKKIQVEKLELLSTADKDLEVHDAIYDEILDLIETTKSEIKLLKADNENLLADLKKFGIK